MNGTDLDKKTLAAKRARYNHATDAAEAVNNEFRNSARELDDAATRHAAAIIAMLNPADIAAEMLTEQNALVRRGINRCIRNAMRGLKSDDFR